MLRKTIELLKEKEGVIIHTKNEIKHVDIKSAGIIGNYAYILTKKNTVIDLDEHVFEIQDKKTQQTIFSR